LLVLQPWQVFIVCGAVRLGEGATATRRFSLAYIEVPRKNGKSQLAAGIGLYMFACDGEFGAEVYSGATTEKQAHEVFRPARR
jgi:phage terminase large subunit-like protein